VREREEEITKKVKRIVELESKIRERDRNREEENRDGKSRR